MSVYAKQQKYIFKEWVYNLLSVMIDLASNSGLSHRPIKQQLVISASQPKKRSINV